MDIPENLIQHIRNEAKHVHHGKIIIELNEDNDKVYVVTENRQLFPKGKKKSTKPGGDRSG